MEDDVIVIQVGQCGNQVGASFLESAARHRRSGRASCRFFRACGDKLVARSVLVDMEPKVVRRLLLSCKGTWRYDEKGAVCRNSGSANNWAFGFNVHGPNIVDDVIGAVEKEVSYCRRFGGVVIIHSAAGGTGSGVGSHITQTLRALYPTAVLLNVVVWPYDAGEVITQAYNTVLTLSSIARRSTAVVVLDNNVLSAIATAREAVAQPTFNHLNRIAARHLALILLPAQVSGAADSIGRQVSLRRLLESACPTPLHKFLTIRTTPEMALNAKHFAADTWSSLSKHLHQMIITGAMMDERVSWAIPSCIGETIPVQTTGPAVRSQRPRPDDRATRYLTNIVLARGRDALSEGKSVLDRWYATSTDLECAGVHVLGNTSIWADQVEMDGYDRVVVALTNSQSIAARLSAVLERATTKLAAHAYLHQYTKYGVRRTDIQQGIVELEAVCQAYTPSGLDCWLAATEHPVESVTALTQEAVTKVQPLKGQSIVHSSMNATQ